MEELSKRKRTEDPDVEAHKHARQQTEEAAVAPEDKADDTDTPDVEAHIKKR